MAERRQWNARLDAYLLQHYERDGMEEVAEFASAVPAGAAKKRLFRTEDYSLRKILMEHLKKEFRSAAHKTFSEALLERMEERDAKPSEIYQRAGITRAHFSKIKAHKDYQPKKETVLAFALALHLTLDETNALLEKAGYTLSHTNLRDVVVEFFLQEKIYDVDEINIALVEHGGRPLSGGRES